MALKDNAIVTLAEVKSQLGISSTSYDTLLEGYINQVSEFLEQYIGSRILRRAGDVIEWHTSKGMTYILPRQIFETDAVTSLETTVGIGNTEDALVAD